MSALRDGRCVLMCSTNKALAIHKGLAEDKQGFRKNVFTVEKFNALSFF
jgi:hypothetical protein